MLTKAVFLICSLAAAVHSSPVNWTNPAVVDGPLFRDAGYCSIGAPVYMGTITDGHLTEISGLAYSRQAYNVLWVHNDSDGSPIINAISQDGRRLADVELKGTTVRDWEDIAVNVENGISYIYLADIGDNKNLGPPTRDSLTIYKFKEPLVDPNWNGQDIVINAAEIEHIHIRYPVEIFDAEAMAVDPLNGDILIFTKDHNNAVSNVFKVPHGAGDPKTMEYVATFPIWSVTGADISATGDTLALINYAEGYSWSKPAGSAWVDYLRTYPEACTLVLQPDEPQREAVTVVNSGYFTTSEYSTLGYANLWYYAKV